MLTQELDQGTPEWHDFRRNHFTASNALAMMGESKHMTREELLLFHKVGTTKEPNQFQKRLFEKGHEAERLARPIAEEIIGQELFPTTGVSEDWQVIAASFDGITMDGFFCWEHKLLNEELRESLTNDKIPEKYKWQLEQQCYVSGAREVLFMASDPITGDEFHAWYDSCSNRRNRLLSGWLKFELDLTTFDPESLDVVDLSTDTEFSAAEERYHRAQVAIQDAKHELEKAKEALGNIAGSRRVQGASLFVANQFRKGSIAYSKVVKDLDVDHDTLERFRNPGSTTTVIKTVKKEDAA